MNGAVTWRCLWREYRAGRPFWLAILALSVTLQIIWLFLNSVWRLDLEDPITAIALAMPLVFALGAAGTSFGREHEAGTFSQLTSLPLRPREIWISKILFVILGACLLLVVHACVLGFLRLIQPSSKWPSLGTWLVIWLQWLVLVTGVGLVCSQLIRRALVATFLAGFGVFFVAVLLSNSVPLSQNLQASIYVLGIGCLSLAISFPLTGSWQRDQLRLDLSRIFGSRRRSEIARGIPLRDARNRVTTGLAVLRRLTWTMLRHQAPILLGGAMLSLVPILFASVTDQAQNGIYASLVLFCFVWPPLLGGTLFASEQAPTHRQFLLEHGADGRQIWRLRQTLGLVVWIAFCLTALAWSSAVREAIAGHWPGVPRGFVTYAVLAFAAGQFASLCIRSQLVSLTFTTLLAVFAVLWSHLATGYAIPAWIAVLPAVSFWCGGWLRARDWLLDRHSIRHWAGPIALPLLGLSLTYAALYAHRVMEIPREGPGFDVSNFVETATAHYDASAAAKILATSREAAVGLIASGYFDSDSTRRANALDDIESQPQHATRWRDLAYERLKRIAPLAEEVESAAPEVESVRTLFAKLLAPELRQAIEDAHGLHCLTNRQWGSSKNADSVAVARLICALSMHAQVRLTQDELDGAEVDYQAALKLCGQLRQFGSPYEWIEAQQAEQAILDGLVLWAAHPEQDAKRLDSLVDWLIAYWHAQPAWTEPMCVDYILRQRLVDELPESLDAFADQGMAGTAASQVFYPTLLMPGEQQRVRRLLSNRFAPYLKAMDEAQRDLPFASPLNRYRTGVDKSDAGQWIATTPIYQFLGAEWFQGLLQTNLEAESHRWATELRLRLVAHRLRFGEYPVLAEDDSLPTTILNQVPSSHWHTVVGVLFTDPITQQPFRYRIVQPDDPGRYFVFDDRFTAYGVDCEGEWASWRASAAIRCRADGRRSGDYPSGVAGHVFDFVFFEQTVERPSSNAEGPRGACLVAFVAAIGFRDV